MAKRPINVVELQAHLAEQLQFLEASADAFDRGFRGEAKRMAATIRILVHQTHRSHSLLGQLGILERYPVSLTVSGVSGVSKIVFALFRCEAANDGADLIPEGWD